MAEALSPRTDALDVIVELLGALDGASQSGRDFYNRLCEACCRLGAMERAGLLLYDDARQLVVVVGGHGVDAGLLPELYGTLEETPIAQVALSEDRVVEVTGDLERWVPERYARIGGVETLLRARVGRRPLARRDLRRPRRHALRADGRRAPRPVDARQDRRARGQRAHRDQPAGPRPAAPARIDLARELHERVIQRLFGVSLVLGSEHELSEEARRRCAEEVHGALADLRDALSRPLAPPTLDTGATLRERARPARPPLQEPAARARLGGRASRCRSEVEPLAQSVLAEALRNADKHAEPSSVRVRVCRDRRHLRARRAERRHERRRACARHRDGPPAGGRGGAAARQRWWSSGRTAASGRCGWWCPLEEDAPDEP